MMLVGKVLSHELKAGSHLHMYPNRLLKQDLQGKCSEGDWWRLSCSRDVGSVSFMALLDMLPKAKDPWFHHEAQFFISLFTFKSKTQAK